MSWESIKLQDQRSSTSQQGPEATSTQRDVSEFPPDAFYHPTTLRASGGSESHTPNTVHHSANVSEQTPLQRNISSQTSLNSLQIDLPLSSPTAGDTTKRVSPADYLRRRHEALKQGLKLLICSALITVAAPVEIRERRCNDRPWPRITAHLRRSASGKLDVQLPPHRGSFPPIRIHKIMGNHNHGAVSFKDGGFGCNNPSEEAYHDIVHKHGDFSGVVGPFISIGTGETRLDLFATASGKLRTALANFKAANMYPARTQDTHNAMTRWSHRDGKDIFRTIALVVATAWVRLSRMSGNRKLIDSHASQKRIPSPASQHLT